ncbi:DUF742 domain-containing protein [Actinophytocola sp.]|uniref:DUF742 domain-containing protein n=1 Tax=Actinophytocola sp. TaxID=1872138 RepID=UPI0025C48B2D|nr:DUF742 domain-containing protein [Actinophytocola sp.]
MGGTRPDGRPSVPAHAERSELPWASAIVRPYAHTGGRTRSSYDLAMEALISTSRWIPPEETTPQRRMIMELCARPRSVAEVAALLSVPLGVARVLLGDLATDGSVIGCIGCWSAFAACDAPAHYRRVHGAHT